MEREADRRITELREKGINIYSISRLNTIHQCPYQAWLNYHEAVPQNSNIWALAGGIIHDKLEEIVKDGANESILKHALEKELENFELLNIHFPLDRNGNPSIHNNWVANMTRFAEEFKRPNGKFETEQLIIYPINECSVMQGFIDVIKYLDDNTIEIWDWKTSSQFTGDHLIEAGRQLVLYALAKQLEGYTVNAIKWVMLKYCETSWLLKNGKIKTKISEWRNLIKDLKNPIEKALIDLGYEDIDIEIMMREALINNSFTAFPKEIQDKFTTKCYVREYEITQDIIDETLNYIKETINLYETLGDNEEDWKPCDIKANSYFCSSLCGYGGKCENSKCKYWIEYCNGLSAEKEESDDPFAELFN